MMTFNEIWPYVDKIEGWLYKPEAEALYDVANSLPEYSLIIELGCYAGRSSIILGYVTKQKKLQFITVDDFSSGDVEKKFHDNMQMLDTAYTLVKGNSLDLSAPLGIDFLFIDTLHTYDHLMKECDMYLPKMNRGGRVAFHDYGGKYTGVTKAVDERRELSNKKLYYSLLLADVL